MRTHSIEPPERRGQIGPALVLFLNAASMHNLERTNAVLSDESTERIAIRHLSLRRYSAVQLLIQNSTVKVPERSCEPVAELF